MEKHLSSTVLLTGVPRSGTTLCCQLLNLQTNTVALHEPIETSRLPEGTTPIDAVNLIEKFVRSARSSIQSQQAVMTKLQDGELPTNPVEAAGVSGLRKESVSLGEMAVIKHLDERFTLVVKHNALFTSLLEALRRRFPVFAIVRNPMVVLASWQSIDMPVNKGHVPMGERFDPVLKQSLAGETDVLERQLRLLEWFYCRYNRLVPESNLMKYEDVIASGGAVLTSITGDQISKDNDLREQLTNSALPDERLDILRDRLVTRAEIYQPFYSSADITDQFEKMMS